MSWVTPVIDRTSSSFYNVSDIVRVNGNIEFLVDYFEVYLNVLVSLPYTSTTPTTSSFGRAKLINEIEGNINSLRDSLTYNPNGWVSLLEAWNGDSYSFKFDNANNIEEDLRLLNEVLILIKTFLDFYRCGSSRVVCGGSFPIF